MESQKRIRRNTISLTKKKSKEEQIFERISIQKRTSFNYLFAQMNDDETPTLNENNVEHHANDEADNEEGNDVTRDDSHIKVTHSHASYIHNSRGMNFFFIFSRLNSFIILY